MKYGIELEYFVSRNGTIIPAYQATSNLDGNPLLGEIKTQPRDSIVDCVFELEKEIYLEQQRLISKGCKMELIPQHQFSKEEMIALRRDPKAIDSKILEVLETFSIYPNGKLGNLLKVGEVKASLQLNFSQNKKFSYNKATQITVEGHKVYTSTPKDKDISCLFNFTSIIYKLDEAYKTEIAVTKRTKGVYAIKTGDFGERIEYRSLPNTIHHMALVGLLKEFK